MGEGNNDSFRDKRRYSRRKLDAAAVVLNGYKYHFEKTAEISEGGMLLQVAKPLDITSLVQIEFILPERRFVNTMGEVIYNISSATGQHYVGIRFVKITDQVQTWIRQFVAEAEARN